jgi:hypothetical protein
MISKVERLTSESNSVSEYSLTSSITVMTAVVSEALPAQ